MTGTAMKSGRIRRYETAVWLIVSFYLLLAAAWAFSPRMFPHRPLAKVESSSSFPDTRFEPFKREQLSLSDPQKLFGLSLLICCLGLLQARILGERAVPGLTLLFVLLNVCTVAGFWFLSLHRGSLSDRGPDAFVRSMLWTCFEIGLVVAGANLFLALVRKRAA
jgi:hypothetical protein